MKPKDRHSLHALLSALVDGTITEPQAAELTRILESDADARRFYIRYLDMSAALACASQLPPVAGRRRMPWPAIAASVAAASLLAASILVMWMSPPGGPDGGELRPAEPVNLSIEPPVTLGYVATILSTSDDALLNGRTISAGTRLMPGPYEVTAGKVAVQFDGGARVFFEGRPAFTLRSRRAMTVHRGTFVFQGDRFSESIEIVTPHSVFKNMGTRYAAVIDAHGEELHVAEGSVRRTTSLDARQKRQELIEAGAGMRYGAANGRWESIPLDAALVDRTFDHVSMDGRGDVPTVVDDFRGAGDEGGEIAKLQSGSGWSEPWRSQRGSLRIVSPGLTGAGSFAVRHDGSGKPAERRSAAHRRFEQPIDLSQDGISYLRFLVRRGPQHGQDEHRMMAVLRTGRLTTEQEVEQGALIQIAFRKDDIAMVRIADALTRVSLPQIPGETYAVVVKIVSGSVNPEQVLVRLMSADRLAGSEEPLEWSVVSDSVSTDMKIEQLSFECTSAGSIEFGDVCIGPTWDSVTGTVGDLRQTAE